MTVDLIYYGSAEALRAEIGLHPCYTEKYQVAAFGPNGEDFTPEGARTKGEMRGIVKEYLRAYPQAKLVFVA